MKQPSSYPEDVPPSPPTTVHSALTARVVKAWLLRSPPSALPPPPTPYATVSEGFGVLWTLTFSYACHPLLLGRPFCFLL